MESNLFELKERRELRRLLKKYPDELVIELQKPKAKLLNAKKVTSQKSPCCNAKILYYKENSCCSKCTKMLS